MNTALLAFDPAEWAVLRLGIDDLISWLEPVNGDDDEHWDACAELLGDVERKLVTGDGTAEVGLDEIEILDDAVERLVDISEYGVISDVLDDCNDLPGGGTLADLGVSADNFATLIAAVHTRLAETATLLGGPAAP